MRPRGFPKLHYGRIGSANTLLKDPKARDALSHDLNLCAFEMEGSGIADGTWIEADLSEEQVSRLDGIVSADRPPVGPNDRAEARELLERMLDTLPEQDRQLLLLKEVEGFSVQELAEILKLNVNTVKVRLFRARGRIMDVYRRRLSQGKKTGAASFAERKA